MRQNLIGLLSYSFRSAPSILLFNFQSMHPLIARNISMIQKDFMMSSGLSSTNYHLIIFKRYWVISMQISALHMHDERTNESGVRLVDLAWKNSLIITNNNLLKKDGKRLTLEETKKRLYQFDYILINSNCYSQTQD